MSNAESTSVSPDAAIATHHRISRFIVVGVAAAAVHWAGVVLLVGLAGWSPIVANVPAWLVAFCVSFLGHQRWTFVDHGAPAWRAARRFFIVSATGFALNESLYALLLQTSRQRYDVLLAVVLVLVAVATFIAGRHWAFARIPGR